MTCYGHQGSGRLVIQRKETCHAKTYRTLQGKESLGPLVPLGFDVAALTPVAYRGHRL